MVYEEPLYEGREYEMEIVFSHLYNKTWAAFRGTAKRFCPRRIIFPDFIPEEGKKYRVRFRVTMTGIFTFKGEDFRVCRAELASSATKGEMLVRQIFVEQPGAMGAALQRAGVGTSANTVMAEKLAAAGFRKRH